MSIGWDEGSAVLPDTTSDETGQGWGDDDEHNDARLIEDVPPHWA